MQNGIRHTHTSLRSGFCTALTRLTLCASLLVPAAAAQSGQPGLFSFTATSFSVLEDAGSVGVVVQRFSGNSGTARVTLSLRSVSATEPEDYLSEGLTLDWADGEDGPRRASIPIVDDSVFEPNEDFRVLIDSIESQIPGALPGVTTRAAVYITDDDVASPDAPAGTVQFQAEEFVMMEGQPVMALNVTRTGGSFGKLWVNVAWSGGGRQDERITVTLPESAIPGLSPSQIGWDDGDTGTRRILVALVDNDRFDEDTELVFRLGTRQVTRIGFPSNTRIIFMDNDEPGAEPETDPDAEPQEPSTSQDNTGAGSHPAERQGIGADMNLTVNARRTAIALDRACQALQANDSQVTGAGALELVATCDELQSESDRNSLQGSLEALAPEEMFVIGHSIVESAEQQLMAINGRLNALRNRQTGMLDLQGLGLNVDGQRIPGGVFQASAEALGGFDPFAERQAPKRLGVFARGTIVTGEVDGAGVEADTDFSTQGLSLGVDFRLSPRAVVGAGLGMSVNASDFSAAGGQSEMDGMSLSLFATWYERRRGYMDVVLDVGTREFDIDRSSIDVRGVQSQLSASTEASVLALSLGVGRDFTVGDWQIGPFARLAMVSADVDGFSDRETDAGAALRFGAQEVRSGTLAAGLQVSRNIKTRRALLVPQLRLEIELENQTDKSGIEAGFVNDPTGSNFTIEGVERDATWINAGLGGSAIFGQGRSAFLFYDTRLAHEAVTRHGVQVGLRFDVR